MRSFTSTFRMLFILVLIGSEGAVASNAGTAASLSPTAIKYLGTATIDISYGGLGLQPQQKRYQQNVVLYIDYPLEAEANIEDNPFHYQATTPKAPGQPGSFSIYSAYRYIPDVPETPTVVWQYWWYRYSEYEGSFQGIYDPAPSNLDNFNIIVAEDATGYLLFCVASIAPESVIDITFFDDNTMTAKVVGEVYNPNIQQLCTRYIQGVEISIDAEEVMDN